MDKSCLILLAHGSRKPSWRKPFKQLLRHLRKECGAGRIYLSFMESTKPSLPDLVCSLVEKGIRYIQILPLFMASGNHMRRDVPEQVRILKKKYPGLNVKILPPIGSHPRFITMMHDLIREYI